MKTGTFQPIISNMTNINIINYNNFDNTSIMKNTNTEKFLNQQQNINSNILFLNFDSEKFGNKTFYNSSNNGEKKQNNLINSNNKFLPNKNMVLTSYNFNQNLKDNILSLYTSTTFDKNFKTFYKGDPYNFDIDMNFLQKNKKMNDKKSTENLNNNLEEEKIKKSSFMATKKMNQTISSEKMHMSNNNFNTSHHTLNGKKKVGVSLHEKLKPTTNVIYEENYQINSKIVPLKFPGLKINSNNLKNIYAKDFHLPNINSKGFSVSKKLTK